jgi:predicted hydrolase (HD superfamily)|tara:strand:+ start:40 stop:267 length:228 start_codon:yes stop_codon:yes gene_type:complete
MLGELNRNRYRALELLAEHVRAPSRELSLDAIISDISDEDLRWVTDKIHYYLLKLLEEADYDPTEEESFSLVDQI